MKKVRVVALMVLFLFVGVMAGGIIRTKAGASMRGMVNRKKMEVEEAAELSDIPCDMPREGTAKKAAQELDVQEKYAGKGEVILNGIDFDHIWEVRKMERAGKIEEKVNDGVIDAATIEQTAEDTARTTQTVKMAETAGYEEEPAPKAPVWQPSDVVNDIQQKEEEEEEITLPGPAINTNIADDKENQTEGGELEMTTEDIAASEVGIVEITPDVPEETMEIAPVEDEVELIPFDRQKEVLEKDEAIPVPTDPTIKDR